jgi:TfoX/Sxy family transcriptional regulator of competence genes
MAWVKIPPENHPLFRAALPRDSRIQTLNMFGGVAAKVNGHLFGGTFGRSVMLLLSPADREAALALDGAAPFDPMGNGAMRSDKVQMPDSIMDEPDELRSWVKRAFDYAATLPPKDAAKSSATKSSATKSSATKSAATKSSAKAAATTSSATKPSGTKSSAKAAAKKTAAKKSSPKASKTSSAKKPSAKRG